jgi:hypothetical protein
MTQRLAADQRAEQAFAAHAAILKAQVADRSLVDNPFWIMLRQDAYERAFNEFEKPRHG